MARIAGRTDPIEKRTLRLFKGDYAELVSDQITITTQATPNPFTILIDGVDRTDYIVCVVIVS